MSIITTTNYTLLAFSWHPELCIGVKYYIVHMYSMPYYTYGRTANFYS